MNTTTKALVAALLAGLTGITIFLFVSLSGGGTASAKTCRVGQRDCLPDVSFRASATTPTTSRSSTHSRKPNQPIAPIHAGPSGHRPPSS